MEKSIEYDTNGSVQLIVCDLKEKESKLSNSSDLRRCYSKAVTLFEKTKTPKKDIGFLFTRFFSGDKSAIVDYKKL
ncbi:hypothetical protein [Commensalibacter nepenthis]|uniref:Uncharacterized protein n=1 Tax=Commensalibacter nepenthis TaxID=3043872 RepID=A0ABT6QAE8_9PROT|nr:hypothetical protein [Commensalibacter sp. TBRC 10068]MDI2113223.1 hypothetical protein [Commensalibacter sp. TBRC 10068]